jgi:L-ascorbate metabolism protein UlaG (beta-lactamase superfamily)
MRRDIVYLKQNVLFEPLFNKWYAWSYLIPPQTAAMYVANSHVKIMSSFIANPRVHVAALKNPAMIGGPFINYDETRVEEIKALLDATVKEQAKMLEMAEAIKSLNETLLSEATGFSLEPLYQNIPAALKGYVELAYDLNNQPSIRFIEGLLYKSRYYDTASQSISLSLLDGDGRSFVFSTPRLKSNGNLHLSMPFSDERLDELFEAKISARPFDHLREALNVADEEAELFRSFFTPQAQHPPLRYAGEGVRIRYFGHACVMIESDSTSILIDPVISYQVSNAISRYTFADLPERISHVLITHNHQDHCMFETLLQLRSRIDNLIVPRSTGGTLADPSLKSILEATGFKNVMELDEMQTLKLEHGSITSIPFFGEHADLNIRTKSSYVVSLKGRSMMFVADSNNLLQDLYAPVRDVIGEIDILFIGMECDGGPLSWLYGPLLTRPLARKMDQSRRFDGSDCEKASNLIKMFNPYQVYVYAMGQEPWLTYLTSIQYTETSRPIVESNKLVEQCRGRQIVAERLYGQKEILLREG